MGRYHVAAAVFAIGCNDRWLDNLLSQSSIPGVTRERRGVSRTIDVDAVLRLAVAHRITRDIGLSVHRALAMADLLVASGGRVAYPDGTVVCVEIDQLRRALEAKLVEATEVLATPRRGRRPRARAERARGG